jgi:cytochrome c oxidase cbb3-type subunit I/II
LTDDLKFPIRPADFTRGQFKGGSTVRDIFRTMTLGLDGTPMPSFGDSMSEEERWAISYFVLSLSAWKDPLTGETLQIPAGARAKLNSPDVAADHPRFALDPAGPERIVGERAKTRRLYPGIRE